MKNNTAKVVYEREAKYLFASLELLCPQNHNPMIKEVNNDKSVNERNEEFPFLFECCQGMAIDLLYAAFLI